MNTQLQSQKKPTFDTASQSVEGELQQHRFAVTSSGAAATNRPSLGQQLQRATTFGHSMGRLSVQAKSGVPVQRMEMNEEEEMQAKAVGQPIQQQSGVPMQRQAGLDEEEPLQGKGIGRAIQRQASLPNFNVTAPGKSLDRPVRRKMEGAFGTSFGNVQVHTESAQAKAVGALAYTQGNHVHFAPGQYKPNTPQGQALLGHELTHVVQQRAGRVPTPQAKGLPINADPALETEADVMGARAARGQIAKVPGAPFQQKSDETAQPAQRSTQPVQFALPLLAAVLPMIMPMMQPIIQEMLPPLMKSLMGGLFGGDGGE